MIIDTYEMLEKCIISVKQNILGSWKKEKYVNLLELITHEKIDINNDKENAEDDSYIVDWNYGNQEHLIYTNFANIEKDLYIMLAQKYLYLGNKTKISTRLKNWDL